MATRRLSTSLKKFQKESKSLIESKTPKNENLQAQKQPKNSNPTTQSSENFDKLSNNPDIRRFQERTIGVFNTSKFQRWVNKHKFWDRPKQEIIYVEEWLMKRALLYNRMTGTAMKGKMAMLFLITFPTFCFLAGQLMLWQQDDIPGEMEDKIVYLKKKKFIEAQYAETQEGLAALEQVRNEKIQMRQGRIDGAQDELVGWKSSWLFNDPSASHDEASRNIANRKPAAEAPKKRVTYSGE